MVRTGSCVVCLGKLLDALETLTLSYQSVKPPHERKWDRVSCESGFLPNPRSFCVVCRPVAWTNCSTPTVACELVLYLRCTYLTRNDSATRLSPSG